MYNICVFAGTTEGRELVEFLMKQPVSVTACVATEYGETLLHPADNLEISARRLTREEMETLFAARGFDLVVDATHPYAPVVTENIARACAAVGTEYLRLLRGSQAAPEDAVFVKNIAEAVDYLNQTEGSILLTTGSKELALYAEIRDFAQRVYARVLPMDASLQICQTAGLPPAHIIAMQGPFSREMNAAMLRAVGAKYMVTKDTGDTGGFAEKVAAAREADATLVVVGRPAQREGLDYAETVRLLCKRFGFIRRPSVTVVGIGPGSAAAMTREVYTAISEADCVIGARRMLEAVARPGQAFFDAIAPEAIAAYILEHPEHTKFAVAMSGDVGFFSGTKKLLPLLSDCAVKVLPGISSLVYLCAKLGTSYEDVVCASAHGRDRDLVPEVRRHGRVFALVGGEDGMAKLCRQLTEDGLGHVKVSVGQRLSYPDEKITVGTAETLENQAFQSLSVALIENDLADASIACGLPDEAFLRETAVPMTKSEVRAVCLSKLRLTDRSVCWDVGAGTGSVSIEMALRARRGQVYAIERKETALELLRENRKQFSAENLTIIPGCAPEACAFLPAPTHVFIGGSSGNMRRIISLLLEKNPKVRIVATAIALESIAELTACMKEFPFAETEVVSLTVARDRKAGPYHLMTGQNPVYIFTLQAGG